MTRAVFGKWRVIRQLGGGGQGDVYLVFDLESLKTTAWDASKARALPITIEKYSRADRNKPRVEAEQETIELAQERDLAEAISAALRMASEFRIAALKTLKPSGQWCRDPEHAKSRLLNEIEILRRVRHPNLQQLLDSDDTYPWFTAEFHSRGDLRENVHLFQFDPIGALRAIRDLVDGVRRIHELTAIHRDIKPENVFVAADGRLILGDFGLVLMEEARDRYTAIGDNAGTYPWMPVWAMNTQHDFMPTIDTYALGKTLWWMLDPQIGLQPQYPVGRIPSLHDNSRESRIVEQIVSKCVVLEQNACLPDTEALLVEIDDALKQAAAPANLWDIRLACHSISRPGSQYLVAVDAPRESGPPDESVSGEWTIWHPATKGRGTPADDRAGIHPDDSIWDDFTSLDEESGRSLISPPEPRSFDNPIQYTFPPIPMSEARYLQFAVRFSDRSPFALYLQFSSNKWIRYSGDGNEGKLPDQPEYGICMRELQPSGHVRCFVRDIREDLSVTWGADGDGMPYSVDGVRIRGDFGLLFFRII